MNQTTRKYRNKPTAGYASKAEAQRASDLKLMERAGLIKDLKEQVRFHLIPKQACERGVDYIADFTYTRLSTGEFTVEDCKGVKTPAYIIKRKLMKFVHGITISEVK